MRWCGVVCVVMGCAGPAGDAPLDDLPGTQTVFRPGADLGAPASFYDVPFPYQARVGAAGVDLTGMPRPDNHAPTAQLMSLLQGATTFSSYPTIYLRFEADVRAVQPKAGVSETADDIWLFPLREGGLEARVPVLAQTLDRDAYVSGHLLGVTPYPGFVLREEVPYALVVRRDWGDASGEPLGVPAALREALRAPSSDGATLGDLGAFWTASGQDLDAIAAATVFRTGDAVGEMAALAAWVRDAYAPDIEALAFDPEDGTDHARFCELHGTLDLPQFQAGVPPFADGGVFVTVDSGLVEQRVDTAPIVLAIPRAEMPASGWPLVFYGHGSDGLAAQVVDRGPVLEVDGERQPGLGPAHVLAYRGIASAGMSTLLGPERLGYEGNRAYLNLQNLAAYRDTWRQGLLDASLFLDALGRLRIDAADLQACAGASLPDGETAHRFDTSALMLMGQSAGAHLSTELAAIDPRVRALAPTGTGGFWSELLAGGSRVGGPPELFAFALGTDVPLTTLHPGLALLQWAWEPAEPMVYANHLVPEADPPGGVKHVYVAASQDDGFFPEPIYDALVTAHEADQAGPTLWESMGVGLGLKGRATDLTYPVSANVSGGDGVDATVVAVQWAPDGLVDPHGLFAQLDGIKHQYGCFFRTFLDEGTPVVVAPGAETAPCE